MHAWVGVFVQTMVNFLPEYFLRNLHFCCKVCPKGQERYKWGERSRKKKRGYYFQTDVFGHLKQQHKLVSVGNSFQKELVVKGGGVSVPWQYMVKKVEENKVLGIHRSLLVIRLCRWSCKRKQCSPLVLVKTRHPWLELPEDKGPCKIKNKSDHLKDNIHIKDQKLQVTASILGYAVDYDGLGLRLTKQSLCF